MLPDEYGCVVTNRFGDLLDDDVDPFDLINEAETEKDKKKKKRQEDGKKSRQKKLGQKESQRDRRVPVGSEAPEPVQVRRMTERVEKEEVHRAMKRTAFGERRTYSEDVPQEFSVPRPSSEDSDVRVRGGFRGGRRGGVGRGNFTRNQDNFYLRGKREYDRHNGTGISPEEKRGGRGPWNWGSVDEAACELMEVTEVAKVKSEEPQSPADEGNLIMQEEEGEVVVHVAVEMSLDEWKALQEMHKPKGELNIRKTENKIPSKAKVIHESKHLENLKDGLEDQGEEGTFLRRSVNDITSLMDINFGSLGRSSRGGRGRGGPRGGMRGGTQPEKRSPAPEVEDILPPDPSDPEDFPALSAGR